MSKSRKEGQRARNGYEDLVSLISYLHKNNDPQARRRKIRYKKKGMKKKKFSDGGIRTPVSAVKEHSDNPYTTSECCTIIF